MITVHNVEQGTPEWQELRAGKYTGSNAHKLLKYGARDYSKTMASEFKGNFWTARGHLLEDEAIELFEEINKVKVERLGLVTNSEFPNCAYSPDGLSDSNLLEVKCFDIGRHLKLVAGDIPLEIMAQIQFGIMICHTLQAILIAYNPKAGAASAFKAITIPRRKAVHDNFRRILRQEVMA